MASVTRSRSFLLNCFSGFYEEVARIKLAIDKGELVRLLQPKAPHAVIEPELLPNVLPIDC